MNSDSIVPKTEFVEYVQNRLIRKARFLNGYIRIRIFEIYEHSKPLNFEYSKKCREHNYVYHEITEVCNRKKWKVSCCKSISHVSLLHTTSLVRGAMSSTIVESS